MRGIRSDQEMRGGALIRDTRTTGQRIQAFFKEPAKVGMLCAMLGVLPIVVPAFADVILYIVIFVFVYGMTRHDTLPFRLPERSKLKDYNDPLPGTNIPRIARGIYFMGNEIKTNKELWFSNDDMRTHCLIFGSTGSGKTVALISFAYNALVQSSGFIYVDGKGDNSLFAAIFSMARFMGREDDLLLINFMTGAKDIIGPQERRLSNTLNPFATGSSGMLANLVTGMMDSGGGGGDGDMWKGRAIAFVEALLKVLVAMRDSGHILLDANTIRNYFPLDRIEAIVEDKVFIRDGQFSISMEHLPDVVLEPIKNYLYTLPGYNKDRKGKQVSQVFEQHGYITMQLTRVFTSLADTYGHIMRTKLAEVDLKDVVLNRRILVVLLPALEKSPDELANLGKVIIASLKAMMAAGLGDAVEGSYHEIVLTKPTNAETPFLCILDEYGYYAVKGFAVVPAQARSLGFSVIFAGQDLPAFQKASKEEAASIGANTNIKICMKLEDPEATWEFFMKSAGETYVTAVDSFSGSAGGMTNSYMDSKSAKTEKRARIDLLDLKDQREGEAHILFKSTIVRAKLFYANPEPCKNMQVNQLLKVDLPKDQELYSLVKGIEDFEQLAKSKAVLTPDEDAQLDNLWRVLGSLPDESSVNRGIEALVGMVRDQGEAVSAVIDTVHAADGTVNIYSLLNLKGEDPKVKRVLVQSETVSDVAILGRLLGMLSRDSDAASKRWYEDIGMSTAYLLPAVKILPDRSGFVELIGHVSSQLTSKVENEEGSTSE